MGKDSNLVKDYVSKFNSEHEEFYKNSISNDEAADWLEKNIPILECSDKDIEETYYFRFWTYRKHIRYTPEGPLVTEFLPDVGWAGPYNTISCPLGHHISEGRWLKDKSIIENDIRFFLKEENSDHAMNYTSSFLWGAYLYCRFSGNLSFAKEILPGLISQYEKWEKRQMTEYGLFWSCDDRDGMEVSISGSGLRPTVNTYMYGALIGIASLCEMTGDGRSEDFRKKAEALKENTAKYLWDEEEKFYKNVPMKDMDSEPDFERKNPDHNVKEEIGFLPFLVPSLARESDEEELRFLTDRNVFFAPYGITTADMSHPRFMKADTRHECLWDGPVWPYATSQTLTALYTLLSEKDSRFADKETFMSLLRQYAHSQKRFDGKKLINWIDEDQDPFEGQWIARELMYLDHIYRQWGQVKERGADYNHSTFCDPVLSGACGIKPDTDLVNGERTITVKPLCAGDWKYFSVKNLSFDGSVFDIYYDADGTKYGFGSTLTLVRDGEIAAQGSGSIKYSYRS